MFSKRPAAEPRHNRHPDPRIEAELDGIRALRRAAVRAEGEVRALLDDAARARSKARAEAGYAAGRVAGQQAQALDSRAAEWEARARDAHDEITKRLDSLGDAALWLDGIPDGRQ